jgi:DNA-directed RNA polymerase specialized sigma24 family protein
MNHPILPSNPVRPALRLVVSHPATARPAATRRTVDDLDPFVRGYRALRPKLRAACARYVAGPEVDDLMQDVWTVASQHPARLTQSDGRTLGWLIGIAKRCARTYEAGGVELLPLDVLLAREAGDDLEGRATYEDVDDLRAARWGDGG